MQHRADGTHDVHDVPHHAPILHIAHIELAAFLFIKVVAPGDLPRAGDAGLDEQTCSVDRIVFLHFEITLRAGANHTHVAHEHVEELWQLVKARFADEVADLRDARVVLELVPCAHLLSICGKHFLEVLVRIYSHRAEFVNVERLAAQTNTFLLVEHGTTVFDLDGDRHNEHDPRREHDGERRDDDVEDALLDLGDRRVLRQADCHDAHALDVAHLCGVFGDVKSRSDQCDLQIERFHLHGECAQVVGEAIEHIRHHHGLRASLRDAAGQMVAVFNDFNRLAPRFAHHCVKHIDVRIRLDQAGPTVHTDRAYAHWLVIELLALLQEFENLPNALR